MIIQAVLPLQDVISSTSKTEDRPSELCESKRSENLLELVEQRKLCIGNIRNSNKRKQFGSGLIGESRNESQHAPKLRKLSLHFEHKVIFKEEETLIIPKQHHTGLKTGNSRFLVASKSPEFYQERKVLFAQSIIKRTEDLRVSAGK